MTNTLIKNKIRWFSLKSIYYCWRNRIRLYLARYPQIYLTLQSFLFGFTSDSLLQKDTDIVIEGFPCSANSFAVRAFQMAQNKLLKIAHHTHDKSQVIAAIQANIPTIVLIRDPQDAVLSFAIRFINEQQHQVRDTIKSKLKEYIAFYSAITPYKDKCVIAFFPEVTNNFGSIITKINDKFDVSFEEFIHNEDNVKKCFDSIESYNKTRTSKKQVSEKSVARPSEYRQQIKARLKEYFQNDVEIQKLHYQAIEAYSSLKPEPTL